MSRRTDAYDSEGADVPDDAPGPGVAGLAVAVAAAFLAGVRIGLYLLAGG